MKKQAFLVLSSFSLFLVLAVASLHAQSGTILESNIPFEFISANQTFPAGAYSLKTVNPGVVLIQSADRKAAGMVTTMRTEKLNASDATKLVFRRYGNTYFLAEIWVEGNNAGRELPKSKAEREVIASHNSARAKATVAATLR